MVRGSWKKSICTRLPMKKVYFRFCLQTTMVHMTLEKIESCLAEKKKTFLSTELHGTWDLGKLNRHSTLAIIKLRCMGFKKKFNRDSTLAE